MKQAEFLNQLERHLHKLPQLERNEILADYKEHFSVALAKGKKEEEISSSLGQPKSLATGYLGQYYVDSAEGSKGPVGKLLYLGRAFFLLIVLAPFNLLFFSVPFGAFALALIGLWVAPLILMGIPFLLLFKLLVGSFFMGHFLNYLVVTAVLFGLFGLGLMGALFLSKLTEIFGKIVLSYVKWNLTVMTRRNF